MKSLIGIAALATASLAVVSPAAAQSNGARYGASSQDEEARFDAAQQRFDREYDLFQQALERYRQSRSNASRWDDRRPPMRPDYDRPTYSDDRDEGSYDPSRYYRPGSQEQVLGPDDRVYRGQDGRYYCRRSDGSTGLIVGAAAGGLFGNAISSRHSRSVGTLLGAVAGAAIGSSVQRNQEEVRCR